MGKEIVKQEIKNNVLILKVIENKIYQNVLEDLRDQLRQITQKTVTKNVVLNLSQVDVINSSGLGILIMLADEMRKTDRNLMVVELKPLLKELFERMRLETIFKIYNTESEALQAIDI